MAIDITFLGHSGFIIASGEHAVVIDPFLTGNDLAKHEPGDVKCTYIALSHGHSDHLGDTVTIARANNATVCSTFEICNYIGGKGIRHIEPANTGGRVATPFGFIAFTPAFHSSSYNGTYMGQPMGVVVRMGDFTFYHAGDTAIFSDMKLIGQLYKPDVAAVPVGDRFTMGPEHATLAAEWIGAKVAIPMHYATFGLLLPDAAGFKPKGVEVQTMAPGDTWQWPG
jgi:L-ascorbate metabolism protein UlaG (beta-lactamase superfamily)